MKRFIAFFVKDDTTGAIEVAEIVEAVDFSPKDIARRIIDRTNELHKRYPIDQYDVYYVSYSSIDALLSTNRVFNLDPANLIRWASPKAGEPVRTSNSAASRLAAAMENAWWKNQLSLVGETDEPLAVVKPRADITVDELKQLGQRLKSWQQANGFARHIWGLDDLMEGRGPRTPPVYLMVPHIIEGIAERFEPVALVFVAASSDHAAAMQSLSLALGELRSRLAWFASPADYEDSQR